MRIVVRYLYPSIRKNKTVHFRDSRGGKAFGTDPEGMMEKAIQDREIIDL